MGLSIGFQGKFKVLIITVKVLCGIGLCYLWDCLLSKIFACFMCSHRKDICHIPSFKLCHLTDPESLACSMFWNNLPCLYVPNSGPNSVFLQESPLKPNFPLHIWVQLNVVPFSLIIQFSHHFIFYKLSSFKKMLYGYGQW